VASLLKLACCREGAVSPGGNSGMGVETVMIGRVGSGGSGVGVRPKEQVGVGGD
jgi:hypothetical protein